MRRIQMPILLGAMVGLAACTTRPPVTMAHDPVVRYAACWSGPQTNQPGAHLRVAMCVNTAERTVLLDHYDFPDLLEHLEAWRVSLAQQVDDGVLSQTTAVQRFMYIRASIAREAAQRIQKQQVDADQLAKIQANDDEAVITEALFLPDQRAP